MIFCYRLETRQMQRLTQLLISSSAVLILLYKLNDSLGLKHLFSRVIKYLKNSKEDRTIQSEEALTEQNEVIFFPELPLVGRRPASYPWSGLSRLLKQLSGARETLDLCLYLVTLPELANVVITLQQTGVRVRSVI